MNGPMTTSKLPMASNACDNSARAFDNFQQRIAIAQEAACSSAKDLSDLRSRLGIVNQYGTAIGSDTVEAEPDGEVNSLTRAIERLTDTVRDIRALAETLNASL